MKDKKVRKRLQEKTEYVERLIDECIQLKKEWEERIHEAEEARDNYRLLIKRLVSKQNEDD